MSTASSGGRMSSPTINYARLHMLLEDIMLVYHVETTILVQRYKSARTRRAKRIIVQNARRYSVLNKIPSQLEYLDRLVNLTDADCIANLRMDRNTFGRLCRILVERGGLRPGRCLGVEEMVAIFVGVLSHHKKNRIVGFHFKRSGATVSYHVNNVLGAVLSLHSVLLSKPTPIGEDCVDHRWKWFPGCLGALDGTHIDVLVSSADKPRYRTRKGHIATNTLAACNRNMQFVYLLAGWEGSAGDSRVLRDAITRPGGFKVPQGCYYLCDSAYANSNGFLTPYKGVRYHLNEWGQGNAMPQDPKELFNMRHTRARNVIERAFAVLKMRWGILRSASYYPIKIQIRLIMACFLLHNFIRREMATDPVEAELDEETWEYAADEEIAAQDYVGGVDPSAEWTQKREALATHMWNNR
ncbi:protein ANTAGONIST OF LIKE HETEROCHROMATIN PROTEIN 1-like isoform X1 [Salvia splendens]|uniref:protein ANTAGONIST OF LIKE HETEROCHROMATIN PROTEIN 1-like isoform X1 n=2 Tax=Salvia splendens TaxID=180675 RepID=UPI001C26AB3C|nr:protein ANTAGONIST OF LIKE HETEROCHROMATIN PROTEIN 1-like isoform X1 [Salvia splendens]